MANSLAFRHALGFASSSNDRVCYTTEAAERHLGLRLDCNTDKLLRLRGVVILLAAHIGAVPLLLQGF